MEIHLLDHAGAAEAEQKEKKKKRKPLTIIISLENVIKSFNLYEDYQLSQQHEFHEHSCGTG